jgi:hypothetical protein
MTAFGGPGPPSKKRLESDFGLIEDIFHDLEGWALETVGV